MTSYKSPEKRTGQRFSNWSGSVRTAPNAFYYPATIAEVQQVVRTLPAGQSIRTVGGGHSFTPVAAGKHAMIAWTSSLELVQAHHGAVSYTHLTLPTILLV